MRNVLDKNCRVNLNAYCMFNKFFPRNRTVYEVMWKNLVGPNKPQTTKTTGTHL